MPALLCLLISTLFHGGLVVALFAAGSFVFMMTVGVSIKRLLLGRIQVPAFITVVLLTLGIFAGGAIIGESLRLSSIGDLTAVDVEIIAKNIEMRTYGEAAYLQGVYPTSILDLVWQTPLRLIYLLLSPMPWHISEVKHVAGVLDAILYVTVFYGIIKSSRWLVQKRSAMAVLVILGMSLVAFGMVTANFGTAMRHRAKFLPILVVLWGVPIFNTSIVLVSQNRKSDK